MNQPLHRKESVVRLVRLLAVLGCLSTNRRMSTEAIANIVPEARDMKFGRRTIQRDLSFLSEVLPIYHDGATPRGYRLHNTVEGHALGSLASTLAKYFRRGTPAPEAADSEVDVMYQVHRRLKEGTHPNPKLHREPYLYSSTSAFAALQYKEEAELRAGQDYSGPQYVFKIVKVTEETLS